MKTKYLFGMLFSGAMLAACTADDLNVAPVAQEVNPSAPVFNVTVEKGDLQNRGTYLMNGHKLSWTEDDLMSLFHGASALTLTGTQNAVYYGTERADGSGMDFVTKAMVQPGYAVMVYPADVAFRNNPTGGTNTNAPVIMVSANQDNTTKDSTAYISEVLQLAITPTKTGKEAQAGYDVDYDIVLKRAVGTWHMPLKTVKAPVISGVDPVEITAVKLISKNASFATQGTVTATGTNAYDETYPSWKGTTSITSSATGAVTTVTSRDLTETNDTVAFTLLPTVSGKALEECIIEVHTTYGVVYIDDDEKTEDNEIWVNTSLKGKDVTEGIKTVTGALFGVGGASSTFKGQWLGQYQTVGLNVDLSKAKLDNMHITKSSELKSVLKVFDYNAANGGEDQITLYLDGDKDNNTFTIEDNETWEAVVKHMAEKTEDKGVTFIACQNETTHNACEVVRLVNDDKAEAQLVPSLLFDEKTVTVELDGLWKYNGVDYSSTAKNEKDITHLGNVDVLKVVKGSKLTLVGSIIAYDEKNTENSTIKLVNEGTVEVSSEVHLKMAAENYGTININGETSALGVENGKTLENMEAQNPSSTKKANGWDEGAVINNEGWLAATGVNPGQVNNYGLINSKGNARTTINENARQDVDDLKDAFDSGNTAIGMIKIFEPLTKDNSSVSVKGAFKGFIALEVKDSNAKFAKYGDVANYIILGEGCTGVTFTEVDKDGAFANLPDNVKYIEIASGKEVKFTGDFALDGLFVKQGQSANIPEGSSVTVTEEVFLKGRLSVGAATVLTTTGATYAGYHGGEDSDNGNIWQN